MSKLNCWEFMKCGKHNGKDNINISDVCPVSIAESANGLNGGKNGGRICWTVAELYRSTWVCCSDKKRKDPCFSCEFRFKVMMEEGLLNVCKATGVLLQFIKQKETTYSDEVGIL